MLAFFGWEAPQEEAFGTDTRIILAAADFGRELTTSVLWLRERDIDIRCLRLRPYRLENGPVLLDVQQIIPLPETSDFLTRIHEKKAAERRERGEGEQRLDRFLAQLSERANAHSDLHRGRAPNTVHRSLPRSAGKAGFSLNYVVGRDACRVELLIQREDARDMLRRLKLEQAEIEAAFGGALQWSEREGVRQCRILEEMGGGYAAPEADWPELQDRLIDAMARLNAAIRSRIAALA